ncbi:MFS transporter [Myxococcota bacterium]|nr:MFS transporter [Myxococcota bacterium]
MSSLLSSLRGLSKHERSVLAATCLSSLGSFYSMAVAAFALPQIQSGLAIPEEEVGELFALIRVGAVFSLFLGVLADRLGRRRLLIASVAGCALFNIATAFAQEGWVLAWLQLGSRFFMAGQILLAGVVVSEELKAENRGLGLGLLSAIGGLGGALTLLVYAFVDDLPYGWRSLFVVGGFGLLWVPWLLGSLSETRRFTAHHADSQAASRSDSAEAGPPDLSMGEGFAEYRWRFLALVAIVLPVWIIAEPGSFFVSKHLQDGLDFSPGGVSLMIGLCGAATPLGNLLSGVLSDRFGRKPATIGVCLMLSVAIGLFYNANGTVVLGLGLGLIFLGIGSLMVLQAALATELFPTGLRSSASGVREAFATIGAAAGLYGLGALYGVTQSHPDSITWLLVLTPIAPIALLFVPETAGRNLEDIAPAGSKK